MRIGIHGKKIRDVQLGFVEAVLEALHHYQPQLWGSASFLQNIQAPVFSRYHLKTFNPGDNLNDLDILISLGGDGTLLESVTYIGKDETPIVGINIGRMGFLATIGRSEIKKAIDSLFQGTYRTDARTMLTLTSNIELFGNLNFALNEFVVLKKETASMINVHVYIGDKLLNSYWADGIIVATPTGSTGYSLSCGGPLLYPASESFVITPISPHNLTARPIVVPDDSDITLYVEGKNKKVLISLDSRFHPIDSQVKLKVKKSTHKANLIQMSDQYYFKTLRQKLGWGLDVRN